MRQGNLMNASRSRSDVTCEISIAGTGSGQSCACLRSPVRPCQKRTRHSFLANDQENQEKIERAKLEPEIPARPIDEQKEKKEKHARVGHQEAPQSQQGTGRGAIELSQRIRHSGNEAAFGQVTQLS